MTICLIFTLLPMNYLRAVASGAGTEEYSERGEGAKAVSGAAITMTSSEDVVLYNVWVGGVQITSENKGNVTGPGIQSVEGKAGQVSFNPESNTLTLQDVIITGIGSFEAFIYSEIPLNIELIGNNIFRSNSEIKYDYGIYIGPNLTISGEGELEIKDVENSGIYVGGILTVSGGEVNINMSSSKSTIYGIYCFNRVIISGGALNITVINTNTEDTSLEAYGIYTYYEIAISNGNVNVRTVVKPTNEANSYGIYLRSTTGTLKISGGNVSTTAISASTAYNSGTYGLFIADSTTISGGTVTAKAYGTSGKILAIFSYILKFTNGMAKASDYYEGSSPIYLAQNTDYYFYSNNQNYR